VECVTDADTTGRPTAELIREFSRLYPGRPIVLMSGYLPEDFEIDAMSCPSLTFLPKPLTGGQLVAELGERIA
jgi:DNA-binding NtrC family response regulator